MMEKPSLKEATRVWAKIGLLSFGGPAGQIALMHRELVEERNWLSEQQFLNALNFCMLLPGPEAMQLAIYSGWKTQGEKGGLIAGLLFVLPGALVIFVLSIVYTAFGKAPLVEAAFLGIKAAVLVIVLEALIKVSKRAAKTDHFLWIAAAAFIALFFFAVPFPLVIAVSALFGTLQSKKALQQSPVVEFSVSWRQSAITILKWLVIWLVPLAILVVFRGPDDLMASIGLFFSKLAVVTFGGAYAVLAYMAQQAVEGFGWLTAAEMVDGLGLAETTPGPLILVTQFVGFKAGLQNGYSSAVAASLVVLWVTFAPCFLWIFAGAPYIEKLGSMPRISSALGAITAAVVGVIANLTVWFSLHVLFTSVSRQKLGPAEFASPDWSGLDPIALVLALLAGILMIKFHRGLFEILGLCAVLGVLAKLVMG
jgi:chromate transporter